MDVPSMVRRFGNKLIVRQVVSGEQEVVSDCIKAEVKNEPTQQSVDDDRPSQSNAPPVRAAGPRQRDSWKVNGGRELLPQCKVKRNYSCSSCTYATQNPRRYLTHLRDTHGEKISINACHRCLYASKHHQKLVRHMRMVHGTVETVKPKAANCEDSNQSKHRPDRGKNDGTLRAPTPSEIDTANAYGQQLVASDFQKLLKQIELSWNSSISAANVELVRNALKIEMDNLRNVVNTLEVDTMQLDSTSITTRRSMDDNETAPRKRPRPIPNLIPLASPPTVVMRPEKELLKPVPMSMLMPQETSPPAGQQSSESVPISQSPTGAPIVRDTHMKCTFCELSYATTVDLANHIEAAHKEDLFTSLLQKSIDESQQNLFPQSDMDSGSNDLWKSLLEVSYGGSESASTKASNELDGKQVAPPAEDDDVEILENKTETYCGVETAPGYGEVTSTLPASADPNAANAVTKKVFKCPHCSFWASTASRFHVHIVGHLNKKPFECSLCSYRSNWRWDITKHIRLKTIRDPSHKNAGVLMNDETGRRNYTKYNKYITLMQIADSSTKDPASYAKPATETTVADLLTACNVYNIDLKAFANIPGYKLLLGQKQSGASEDMATANEAKQYAAYQLKCKVCEFRTSSNEELVLHMTTTHTGPAIVQLDDVIETEPSGAPTVEPSNALQPRHCTVVNSVAGATSPSVNTTVLCSISQSAAANTLSDSSTNGTVLLTTSGAGDRTNPSEQQGPGEGDGGSQRTAVPAWRHNAPYRCGHCHQVSNWKHVIQRHCRLKHNGNVLIEHLHSEKDDPSDESEGQSQRHPIAVSPSDRTLQSTGSLVATTIPPPLAPFSFDELGYPVPNTLEPIVEIFDKDPADLIDMGSNSTVLVSSGTVAPAVPGEQLDCVSCQFHAETVEQLTEHLEAHISNGQLEGSYSIAPTTLLDPVPTAMFYCSKCPARFFDRCHVVEHEERHATGRGTTVCPVCTYVPQTGDEPSRHLEVHTGAYNKNTENLQIFLAESEDYPKPRLTMRKNTDQTEVWYVEPVPEGQANVNAFPPDQPTSPKRSKRFKQQHPRRSVDTASIGTDQPPLRSIFLCEYCDNAFDAESDLNAHVRNHFSAILAAQNVAYYTSLNGALRQEKALELVVSGAQSTLPLHYVYDNTRSKEWAPFSKKESVLLKL